MRRTLLFGLCSAVVIAFAACSTSESCPADASCTDAALPDIVVEEAPKCAVSGKATDMNDVGWSSAKVSLCNSKECLVGDADDKGDFKFYVECNLQYHVKGAPPFGDPRPGSVGIVVMPQTITADTTVPDLVRIPETPNKVTLTTGVQSVVVTPELTLTFDKADIEFIGDEYIAGTIIPQAKWPKYAITGKTILGMWALNPWPTTAKKTKTIGVTIKNSFGMIANDKASVYAVEDTTTELLPPTEGIVGASDITGATVDRITWIILAK